MARPDLKLLGMLGWIVTGDMGPWTFYTSARGPIVFFPRMPALNPPSPKQVVQRARIRAAAVTWRAKTSQDRGRWEQATQRPKLCVTGFGLWVWWSCNHDLGTLRTIERQSGVSLI